MVRPSQSARDLKLVGTRTRGADAPRGALQRRGTSRRGARGKGAGDARSDGCRSGGLWRAG